MDIPQYAGGKSARVTGEAAPGALRTGSLSVAAQLLADSLVGWANDIEAEERRRQTPPSPGDANRQQGNLTSATKPGTPPRNLKEPSKEAIAVYRYQMVTGKKQTELADDPQLMKALRRKVDQGTISRWLRRVADWIRAGNVLPPLPDAAESQPTAMHPEQLDIGPRRDGRAKRQRGHRQALDNPIIRFATAIREGRPPLPCEDPGGPADGGR
jgi:hypothetical protein